MYHKSVILYKAFLIFWRLNVNLLSKINFRQKKKHDIIYINQCNTFYFTEHNAEFIFLIWLILNPGCLEATVPSPKCPPIEDDHNHHHIRGELRGHDDWSWVAPKQPELQPPWPLRVGRLREDRSPPQLFKLPEDSHGGRVRGDAAYSRYRSRNVEIFILWCVREQFVSSD